MDADTAREIIGTRFLADPNFVVSLDGTLVTFDDIPTHSIQKVDVDVPGYGSVQIVMIDSQKADRTTRQHGIAWRVNTRLVGVPGWIGFDHERILDGRSTEAKRFQFIVSADRLENSVKPDWTGFVSSDLAWQATRDAVHAQIKKYLSAFSADRRREAKETVKKNLLKTVRQLPPVGRERWNKFVDEVIDSCPSISIDEVGKVAGILYPLFSPHVALRGLICDRHPMGEREGVSPWRLHWRFSQRVVDGVISIANGLTRSRRRSCRRACGWV